MKDFNFFEPYVKAKEPARKTGNLDRDTNIVKIIALVLGLVLLATVAGTTVWNLMESAKLKKEITEVDRILTDTGFQNKLKSLEEKQAQINNIKLEKTFLENLEVKMDSMDKVNEAFIDFIAGEVVDNLHLNKIEVKENDITIDGISLTRMGIAQFEYDLRKNGDFQSILVEGIEKDEDNEGYNFKMSLKTKGGFENENK